MTKKKVGKKMGAPTKYDPGMLVVIKDLMSVGASKTEVCGTIGICFDTLLDWMDKDSPRYVKDFSDSINNGQVLSQVWWEKEARMALKDKDFNSTLWYMNMKNRFRKAPEQWADKSEVDNNHTIRSLIVTSNVVD